MAKIDLVNVTKTFGKTVALDGISLHIRDREFFVLFGPAGAGKTTILNNIAGIQIPDAGEISFDGEVVNLVEAADRNVAMVFENYALYPHMTVYDNIASPMRSKRYHEEPGEMDRRIRETARMLDIDGLLDRLPAQLSNGQKQRVSLGRALVRKPRVYLMDEPIAHLDAKLRNHMRAELKSMQKAFDSTTIYVTHDYTEALSLGDRIAIINLGRVEQVGTGEEVFSLPANEFVARLMGEPEINLIDGQVVSRGGELRLLLMDSPYEHVIEPYSARKLAQAQAAKVHVGFRGYDAVPCEEDDGDGRIRGTVYNLEPIGNRSVLTVRIGEALVRMLVPNSYSADLDQVVYVRFKLENAVIFDAETMEFITRHGEEQILQNLK